MAGAFQPGISQRRDKIFLAFALEFFLRCFESRDARSNFFPLACGVIQSVGHARPS